MAKVEAFVRILNHGITDPTSGATIPFTNNNTDGTWLATDLYDREILINSSTGLMQYRAGNTIYNVAATTGDTSGSTKVVQNATTGTTQLNYKSVEIGPWDMNNLGGGNDIINVNCGINASKIIQIHAQILTDPQNSSYAYTYTDLTHLSPLIIFYSGTTATLSNTVNTYFADNTLPPSTSFSSTTNNRGYVNIFYKD
jgi:hypothetical protein